MTTRYLEKSLLLVAVVLCGQALFGQTTTPATIITYAGNDAIFAGAGQPATAARLVNPNYMAFDAQGNLYFSDSGLSMVLKVSAATGVISVVAGNGLSTGGGDGGLAVGASLGSPQGLAFDSSGNLYIADGANNNVRKVDTNGIITTVAGSGQGGFGGDGGLATKAYISKPVGIAIDKTGNLYIADSNNRRIRMVAASTGIISTIAGAGPRGYTGDGGPATQATLTFASGIAVDSSGNVYVADVYNSAIRKISTGGMITTVAGGQGGFGGDNGPATKAGLSGPMGVTVDASGNLYIADTSNERVRYVSASGIITTIAGTGTVGFSGDGSPATAATLDDPVAVAPDASGAVYVADMANGRVRRFVVGGNMATFAGTAISVGDGGPSTQARLDNPMSAAVDSSGNLYIADGSANRVRKVTPSGTITTVAGNGEAAYGGDNGPGPLAALNDPDAVAVDSAGNVYIADYSNSRIRRVDASTGIITTFAGNGNCCYAGAGTGGDGGPATAATLHNPTSLAVDGAGNVYLVDAVQNNNIYDPRAIRRVTTDGKINIWASGATTTVGYSGDGGSPLQAEFGYSISIAAGAGGTLYIADTSNNRIRKIDPAGSTISLVAGNGQSGDPGNGGPALSASVTGPSSVALDAAGNLYVGETGVVRQITPSGVIGPYAGNGQTSFSGDGGPALSASITAVDGLAVD
jgi:sugar lactone lactonase YvrE